MIWTILLYVHFLISLIAIITHLTFLRLVVFSKLLNKFASICLFFLCICMKISVVSNIGVLCNCLFYGTQFEYGECVASEVHIPLIIIHTCGEGGNTIFLLFAVIDAIIAVRFIKLHDSPIYSLIFLTFIFISILLISFFVYFTRIWIDYAIVGVIFLLMIMFTAITLIIYLKHTSKNQYYNTQGKLSLSQRYVISSSHELSRCFMIPALISLTIKVIYFTASCFVYFSIYKRSLEDKSIELVLVKYYFILNMVTHLEISQYSINFIYLHRSLRRKVCSYFGIRPKTTPKNTTFARTLNGSRIEQSTDQYFKHLRSDWEVGVRK